MDFDSIPDESQPSSTPPAPKNAPPARFDDIPDETKDLSDYETPGQQLLTAVEARAKGFAGPIATGLESGLSKLGVPGLSPEDQLAREQANPNISKFNEIGSSIASFGAGVGVPGAIAKAGELAVGAARLAEPITLGAKAAAAAIKGAINWGGLTFSDELSNHILGKGNPEDGVASALSHTGASTLFGAAFDTALTLGGAGFAAGLRKLASWDKAADFGKKLSDFGNRWEFLRNHSNMVEGIYNELKNLYESTKDAASEVYGDQGLKSNAIDKLTSSVTPDQVQKHIDNIGKVFEKIPRDIKSQPLFRDTLMNWEDAITSPGARPSDVFKATDNLKRQFQEWSKYNKQFVPVADIPFRNAAMSIANGLKESLEDSSTWNEAADLQKNLNKAVAGYINPLKKFQSVFTTKDATGEPVIDPQKIKTYINTLGKTGAGIGEEIRPQAMKSFVEAAENYRDEINKLHLTNGLETPLDNHSLDITKSSYGDQTEGGMAANDMYANMVKKISAFAGAGAGAAIGHYATKSVGAEAGEAVIGAYLGDKFQGMADKLVGGTLRNKAVPFVLKMMESARPTSWAEALDHAKNITRGDEAQRLAVDSIFTGASLGTREALFGDPDEKRIEKLKKFVSEGGLNQQIENSLHKESAPQLARPQGFAEGGMVTAKDLMSPAIKQNPNPQAETSKLAEVYPEHAMIMAQAKGRVYNYLNASRPQNGPAGLPFDSAYKDPAKEKSYQRALHIADKPLSIIKSIQKGTLDPEEVSHMRQMWPEVYNSLSKKLTMRMTEARLKEEKMPPYHVRQSLALFLGAPLDSAMTPSGIMAAQSVFAKQRLMTQAMGSQSMPKSKKDTSKLGQMTKQYQTNPQAAAARQLEGK